MKRTPSHISHRELVNVYRRALAVGLPLETLNDKIETLLERSEVSQQQEKVEDTVRAETLKKKIPGFIRYGALALPLALLGVGLFLISNAVVPIVSYYISTLPGLQAASLITPIPREQVLDVTPLMITSQALATDEAPQTEPVIVNTALDYTNLANWFDAGSPSVLGDTETLVYTLDIPSLNIENAEVAIGGTDLNHSLIQYPGTAKPGELGSPVIFGHSVLRQFYNPSENNPRRYNSIFSTIMTLKKGDMIYLTHDGVKYSYMVQEKTEVKPEDTFILNQKYDGRRLKLVTCTPEGTYLRRGVVTAQLVQN